MLVFITVVFSIFVAGAEIDIAIPSFPEMRHFYNVSPFMVELVLGVNLLAHCVAALFCGNLGDKYGKKRIINLGFAMFVLGSLVCAITPNFYILLLGRILQGAGVAPAMVLSFIIAIERHKKEDQPKIMGFLNGFIGISIAAAPSLGSYVSYYFGWRGNFWLLFVLGILALITFIIFIPNDRKNEKSVKINLMEYIRLMKNRLVLLYVITLCVVISAYYTFVGLAPIIYIEALGVELKNFGFYQGALALTFGVFSIVSGVFIKTVGKKNSFIFSVVCVVLFVLCNLVLVVLNIKNPLIITLVALLLSIGFVVPCNAMFVLALEVIPSAKGRVSALISTIKWVFSVIGIQTASYFYNANYVSTGIIMVTMVILGIILGLKLWQEDENLKKALI